MPAIVGSNPGQAPGAAQLALTGRCRNPAAHLPGGAASPCAPAGRLVTQALASAQTGTVSPPSWVMVVPEVQNERSPWLAASMAATTTPRPAKVLAIVSRSARPPP